MHRVPHKDPLLGTNFFNVAFHPHFLKFACTIPVRETVFECLVFEDDTYTQNGSGWVPEVDGHCFYPLWDLCTVLNAVHVPGGQHSDIKSHHKQTCCLHRCLFLACTCLLPASLLVYLPACLCACLHFACMCLSHNLWPGGQRVD